MLNTSLDPTTKVVKLVLGDAVSGENDADGAVEMWGPPGIISMPAPPTSGAPSCQTIVLKRGDHDIVIALRDTRAAQIYGNLKAGETAVFATVGQARGLFKADGSINFYTTVNNQPGGNALAVSITPSTDTISAVNSKGYGFIINDNGVTLSAGAASLTLNSNGSVSLVGTASTQIDGGNIILGSVAIPVTNSVLVGVTGVAGVPSTKVFAALS